MMKRLAWEPPTGSESKLRVTGGEDVGSSSGGVWVPTENGWLSIAAYRIYKEEVQVVHT